MLHPLILASLSPRRAEILQALKIPFQIESSYFDEDSLPFTGYPQDYVCQLARGKATTVARRHPSAIVIGADTLVFIDGKPFGKPADEKQAYTHIEQLSGKWNTVYTGVSISYGNRTYEQVEESRVLFNPLTPEQIAAYVASNEWQGRSGGYTLQGWGALLIAKVEGCCHNVMGLPLNTLQQLLLRCGTDLWNYAGKV
jgi:septum formation protein